MPFVFPIALVVPMINSVLCCLGKQLGVVMVSTIEAECDYGKSPHLVREFETRGDACKTRSLPFEAGSPTLTALEHEVYSWYAAEIDEANFPSAGHSAACPATRNQNLKAGIDGHCQRAWELLTTSAICCISSRCRCSPRLRPQLVPVSVS